MEGGVGVVLAGKNPLLPPPRGPLSPKDYLIRPIAPCPVLLPLPGVLDGLVLLLLLRLVVLLWIRDPTLRRRGGRGRGPSEQVGNVKTGLEFTGFKG